MHERLLEHSTAQLAHTAILHTALYGCKTWSFTLREGVPGRGAKGDIWPYRKGGGEVTGERRKCYNGLHDLYSLPNITREINFRRTRRAGAYSTHAGGQKCVQSSGGET